MTDAPTIETIRAALRNVADPEIGANIVDLGLIYRIDLTDKALYIEMTMTSPACPMGDMIIDDAHTELGRILPADIEVDIKVVWNPPWEPKMMSEQCRQRLGWTDSDSP